MKLTVKMDDDFEYFVITTVHPDTLEGLDSAYQELRKQAKAFYFDILPETLNETNS